MNKMLAFAVAFLATLALVLVPVRVIELASKAQVSEYEYEVLSGIDPGMYNLKITQGWHGAYGIDLIYDKDHIAGVHATLGAEVHPRFRHVGGDLELKARVSQRGTGVCKRVRVELFRSEEMVATLSYFHVEPSIFVQKELNKTNVDRTTWTLKRGQQVTIMDESLGAIVRERWPIDGTEEKHGVENARARYNVDGTVLDYKGCSTGPHLHQSGVQSGVAKIHPNRDSTPDKGLPYGSFGRGGYLCISPDEWIIKIVSPGRTPAVTATDAPTTTCPPTNLKLTSGSALTLEFDSPNDVELELYKADGSGAFCDADASSCSREDTEDAGAASVTAMFTKDNPLGADEPEIKAWPSGKYRARGRGCAGGVCGAWSAWSDTIDHIAPPTNPALVSNPTGTLIMRYRSFGVSGSGKHVFRLQRTGLDRAASFCELEDPETRSCRSADTREQDLPRSAPGEDAVHSVFFGAHAEGKYRAQAKSCKNVERARDGTARYACGAWSDFSPVIYHIYSPESIGLVSNSGTLGVSFKSLRAARFQLYKSSGSTCTVGEAGCTLVATITAEASASAALRQARFGQRTGGAYWVRGQSCLTSGAGGSGGVGGAAGTPGPRVATDACGAWSALSPQFTHRVPSFGTSRVGDQSWTEGSSVSLTLPAATGGDGTLTYSLSPALPSGVTRTNFAVSGAPSVTKARTEYTWTATDTHGDKASITFHVAVAAEPTTTPDPTSCTLTVKVASGGGTTTPAGTHTYDPCPSRVSLSASPNAGYRFDSWSGSGVANTASSATTVAMSAGVTKTVTASFARIPPPTQCKLTVRVSPSGGGTTTPAAGTRTYSPCPQSVSLSASPSTGYRFGSWSGAVSSRSVSASVPMRPGDRKTVTAGFTRNQYRLNVGVSPSGAGTVTRSPSKSHYYYGETVTLTASPSRLYYLQRWAGATATGTVNEASVTIRGLTNVTAYFRYVCNDHSHGYFGPCLQGAEEPEPPP